MIRVLIERHIAADLESAYEKASREMLQKAIQAPGYISGESLKDIKHPNRRYILCKWVTFEHWQQWYHSQERVTCLNHLRPVLDEDEKITVLAHQARTA